MNILWIIVSCLLWLLGVSCAKADEIKIASRKLSTPTVVRQYRPCSPRKSPSSKCVLRCSVRNAPDATLTIYNGSSTFSSTKVADLNIDLSLCLEVEYRDKNNYSCVVDDHYSSQTTYMDIRGLCQTCTESNITEAVPVTEEESFTIHNNVTQIHQEDHLLWMFECIPSQPTLIAEIIHNKIFIYDCKDQTFKDRLLLDSQTGDLTITNATKNDSGHYEVQIYGDVFRCWNYIVTVYAPLLNPVITKSSSILLSQNCSLLCSVFNVSAVSLSWYKGNSLLSSISVSKISISLSLPLEVEYQEKNNYSCVVNNTIRNQTTHLDINNLCRDQRTILILFIWPTVSVLLIFVVVVIHLCKKNNTKEVTSTDNTTEHSPGEQENEELISHSSSQDTQHEYIRLLCWK